MSSLSWPVEVHLTKPRVRHLLGHWSCSARGWPAHREIPPGEAAPTGTRLAKQTAPLEQADFDVI